MIMAAVQGFAAYSQYAANIWNSKVGAVIAGAAGAFGSLWAVQSGTASVPALTPASTMGA